MKKFVKLTVRFTTYKGHVSTIALYPRQEGPRRSHHPDRPQSPPPAAEQRAQLDRLGILGRAQELYGAQVSGYSFLSNHYLCAAPHK
jgi:hypothetical protein